MLDLTLVISIGSAYLIAGNVCLFLAVRVIGDRRLTKTPLPILVAGLFGPFIFASSLARRLFRGARRRNALR